MYPSQQLKQHPVQSLPPLQHQQPSSGDHIDPAVPRKKHSSIMASSDKQGTPHLKVPEGNDNVLQKAAAPIATLASHADPWPHYLMTGGCGASALYSYSSLGNPRMAAIKAALGLSYLWAGRQLVTGNPTLGYDVGTVTSLALLGVAAPRARATSEAASVAMSALGGLSAVSNLVKSYEMRTGKPKELGYERR